MCVSVYMCVCVCLFLMLRKERDAVECVLAECWEQSTILQCYAGGRSITLARSQSRNLHGSCLYSSLQCSFCLCPSVCLSLFMFLSLPLCLYFFTSVCIYVSLFLLVPVSICLLLLSLFLSVSLCLSVFLPLYLSPWVSLLAGINKGLLTFVCPLWSVQWASWDFRQVP